MRAQELKINKINYKIEFSFSDNSISLFEFIMNRIEESIIKERKREDVAFNNLT
ncbi:MAG: hypothetical protein J1F31_00450 [Erysipelotrichales bacterium]|nr:hypothetical protein [Erysipelotrichales bacterium]